MTPQDSSPGMHLDTRAHAAPPLPPLLGPPLPGLAHPSTPPYLWRLDELVEQQAAWGSQVHLQVVTLGGGMVVQVIRHGAYLEPRAA